MKFLKVSLERNQSEAPQQHAAKSPVYVDKNFKRMFASVPPKVLHEHRNIDTIAVRTAVLILFSTLLTSVLPTDLEISLALESPLFIGVLLTLLELQLELAVLACHLLWLHRGLETMLVRF